MPPPKAKFSEVVNQWVIYDAYVDYEYQKEIQDEQERLKARSHEQKKIIKRLLDDDTTDEDNEFTKRFLRAARTLERMVNQNIFTDVSLGKSNSWLKCVGCDFYF